MSRPRLPGPQREVVTLAAAGLPNKEIAARLGLPLRVIERRMILAARALGVGKDAVVARWEAVGGDDR